MARTDFPQAMARRASGNQTLYGEHSDRIKPFTILMGMHNAAAAWIALEHGLLGPNLTYSTACSSSTVAIGEAWLRVASGQVDVAIAGGGIYPHAGFSASVPIGPASVSNDSTNVTHRVRSIRNRSTSSTTQVAASTNSSGAASTRSSRVMDAGFMIRASSSSSAAPVARGSAA